MSTTRPRCRTWPATLRARLAGEWETRALEVVKVERSTDGTLKAMLEAHDGARIESVLIPEEGRTTLCVSTQHGCPLACSFCATGALGFGRNLTTAEIIDQVCRMRELLDPGRRISNVVFMGMGEPLLNLGAVLPAVRLLVHPKAFAMAPRRVTVSTVGIVPRIGELLRSVPVNLAVSLHASTRRGAGPPGAAESALPAGQSSWASCAASSASTPAGRSSSSTR